jgi:transposase
MQPPLDLAALDAAAKDALILSQAELTTRQAAAIAALTERVEELLARNAALTKRVKELEAKLGSPPKTPDNSSLPPSRGQKPSPGAGKPKPKKPHEGAARALHPDPTRTVEARAECCPHCAASVAQAPQIAVEEYDRIELPEIVVDVTRVVVMGGTCPCCKKRFRAAPPQGLEPGSPWGTSLRAALVYLRMAHAISIERLRGLCRDLFGLDISEGALIGILKDAREPVAETVKAIEAELMAGSCLASDETGVRVGKKTGWLWIFHHGSAAVFRIALSRGKDVVEGFLGEHRPDFWLSDRLGSQMGWARKGQQVCLAHLIRDAQYAIDAGDSGLAPGLKRLFEDACAVGGRRSELKDATLRGHVRAFEKRLDRLLGRAPSCAAGKKLRKAILRFRQHLFVFLENREIEPTNNGSERGLRPAATFRKVTNCFRTAWGAKLYADARSILETARRMSIGALRAIRLALAGEALPAEG